MAIVFVSTYFFHVFLNDEYLIKNGEIAMVDNIIKLHDIKLISSAVENIVSNTEQLFVRGGLYCLVLRKENDI